MIYINLQSVLFGILPESVFFALFIIFAKQIKKHRIILIIALSVLNVCLGHWFVYTVYYHIFFIMGAWLILWVLFRAHIIDVFLITSASYLLIILSGICLFAVEPLVTLLFGKFNFYNITNYEAVGFANRALIFVILYIIRNKLSYCYAAYRNSWNRKDGAKIKSITVRNISCVALNMLLFILHILIIQYSIK